MSRETGRKQMAKNKNQLSVMFFKKNTTFIIYIYIYSIYIYIYSELNTFLNLRLAFDFQPHGFVRASVSPRAMRLGFVRANDVAMLALDAFVYCFVLVNIAVLCRQYTCMHRHTCSKPTRISCRRA